MLQCMVRDFLFGEKLESLIISHAELVSAPHILSVLHAGHLSYWVLKQG